MLLAIDAGNTNVVFALVDGRTIKARWRIATDPRRTADEYAVWLSQLLALEGYARSDVSAVVVATVVPRALHNIEVLAQKYFGTTALIAGQPPLGIRINCVAPGIIATEGMAVYSEEARREMPNTNLMRRFGEVEDVANAVVYLASGVGGFVTGEVLTVDGGNHVWGDQWTIPKPDFFKV